MDTMTVANTILEQLGGGRFIAMTGAKNLVGDANSLRVMIGRNEKRITHVVVMLEPSDTYTVTFWTVKTGRNFKMTERAKHSNVYAEDLQELFTAETGLYTRL